MAKHKIKEVNVRITREQIEKARAKLNSKVIIATNQQFITACADARASYKPKELFDLVKKHFPIKAGLPSYRILGYISSVMFVYYNMELADTVKSIAKETIEKYIAELKYNAVTVTNRQSTKEKKDVAAKDVANEFLTKLEIAIDTCISTKSIKPLDVKAFVVAAKKLDRGIVKYVKEQLDNIALEFDESVIETYYEYYSYGKVFARAVNTRVTAISNSI